MATTGAVRAARAAVFTAVCVLLTAFGHAMTGESMPGPAAALWGSALVFVLAVRLAGRERSLAQIAVGMGVTQLALHELFHAMPATAVPATVTPTAHQHMGDTAHMGHLDHSGSSISPLLAWSFVTR